MYYYNMSYQASSDYDSSVVPSDVWLQTFPEFTQKAAVFSPIHINDKLKINAILLMTQLITKKIQATLTASVDILKYSGAELEH